VSRIWSSGFELNSLTAGVEIDSTFGTVSISSTTFRSGAYALRANPTTATGGVIYRFSSSGLAISFYRFYLYITSAPDTTKQQIYSIECNTGESFVNISLNSDRTLSFYQSGADQIGSSSSALSLNTWYRIEISLDATTISATSCVARIDGTNFASGTIDYTGNPNPDTFLVGAFGSNRTSDLFFDDIAINNSTGSFQNSWPGAGEIIHLLPNATGDNSDWGGDNTDIDEVTPDDDTTKITSATVGNIEDVNLAATPAALASDDTINVVQIGVRFANALASSTGFVTRIMASSGGTVEESSEITYASATYVTNAAAAPRNYALTLYDLPGASTTAWTKADLDTAQIGVRKSAAAAVQNNVSTLWLLVDHTPAVAGGNDLSDVILRNESLRLLRVGK